MSLKVYYAYRLKDPSDLWGFARYLRRKMTQEVKKALIKRYIELGKSIEPDSEEYKKALEDVSPSRSLEDNLTSCGHSAFGERYRKQAKEPYKNMFDYDCSVVFREYQGQVYLIPYFGSLLHHFNEKLRKDPRLVEYGYWNNTDRPDRVSPQEWGKRKKVWHALTEEHVWRDFLTLEILSQDNYIYVDPYYTEMQILWAKQPHVQEHWKTLEPEERARRKEVLASLKREVQRARRLP